MASVNHERLLLQTADILDLLFDAEAGTSTQSKQKLVQTVSEFNRDMATAKDGANALPGGQLLIEEQDEIIEMLEQLKRRKQHILNKFASDVAKQSPAANLNVHLELDSTASTPAS